MNKLREQFKNEIRDQLAKSLKKDNILAVPTLEKIVINVGLGEVITNAQALEKTREVLELISGQKPLVTKARKAISNFKIRKGLEIGLKVTLRRDRMWDFLEKLISIVLPRIKDFRGVSRRSFDGEGNYSIGLRDHTIFPEIDPNKVDKIRSLQIIIVTSADNNEEGLKLLEILGMPFAKEEDVKAYERVQEAMKKEKKDKAKLKAERVKEGRKIEESTSED
jgi:large subunit ribosomal protein L5